MRFTRPNSRYEPAALNRGSKSACKPIWIGFLPESAPLHKRMIQCFTDAGFRAVRVQVNRDYSMATFGLRWGTHSWFRGQRQAHAYLLRLLQAGGFRLTPNGLSPIAFRGDGVEGAFSPVRLRCP